MSSGSRGSSKELGGSWSLMSSEETWMSAVIALTCLWHSYVRCRICKGYLILPLGSRARRTQGGHKVCLARPGCSGTSQMSIEMSNQGWFHGH